MNAELQHAKRLIRPYLNQVSDAALWQLRAMSRDGKMVFDDRCKCIRGVAGGGTAEEYIRQFSKEALDAEVGLRRLGECAPVPPVSYIRDRYRNLRLLPMVKAEIRKRDRRKIAIEENVHAECC